jgi:SPOR domain
MDQKTSNDADKRNWRERLGIGTKDMPRISDEFAKPKEPVLVAEQPKPRQGQPIVVAKPAPMAPRVATKPVDKPAPVPAATAPAQNATAGRPMQPAAPQTPDVLAERLRNQRMAAEKLAEQRVSAARERAEANKAQATPAPSPQPQQPSPRAAAPPPPKGKPKFTFSEDELKAEPRREPLRQVPQPQLRPSIPPRPSQGAPMQPQLSPPRPTLGGDRPVMPQGVSIQPQVAPPPAGGFPPQFRPAPYRPIDPATGYVPPSQPFQPTRGPMPAQGPRPPAPDPRARPRLGAEGYVPDPLNEPALRMPRYEPPMAPMPRPESARQQNYNFDSDYSDEIFEDPSPPPRRASATDYHQAYRDQDEMYQPERRRSRGPWMLLGLLLLAAAAAGGGIFAYQNYIKTGANGSAAGEAPVVAPPETPDKTTAEATAPDTQPPAANQQPLNKKQIYDRIIGDKEVPGGQLTPTEEAPVQPPATQGSAQPTDGQQPAPASASGEDPLPLPMPPPPGSNTQGAVPQPAGATQIASTSETAPAPAAIPQPSAPSSNQTMIQEPTAAAPAPEQPTPAAAEAQPEASQADQGQEQIGEEPAPPVKPKATKKAQAEKPKSKPKSKQAATKPVVLVPPADGEAATQDPDLNAAGEPPLQAGSTPEPAPAPVKKKKTLLGLFTGENNKVEEAAPAETQVAAIQPQPQAQQPAQQATSSGFVVQLTSYRSQEEAQAEARRVASKYGSILGGLSPTVLKSSAGGSTRYRVAFGTAQTRGQASDVCQKLNAAGERDCIIGRR